ncbi:MAG: CDP-2,3-bis-(O-geranylgeranyl)-sn-glycerol synthase [Methanobacteriota archaeon]|nr:MAG: CDP-2,3-bis-(O-geranylgeranyl)-sn-glycerol synthase [Euryarchaeota archaeon]
MTPVEAALAGLWLMLPALVPNSAAVLLGGGRPIDFGRSWRGRRILGDGKTWRGFTGGAGCGIIVGLVQIAAADLGSFGEMWAFGEWPSALTIVVCLGLGSMLGDSMGSFIKRRLGVGRGKRAPGLDQYNFVIGAVVLVAIFNYNWFQTHYIEGVAIWSLVALLVVVPALHRGINVIGYRLGRKDVPW